MMSDAGADHFRHEHYLCNHQLCLERKFIVFMSEQELKQHAAREHGGDMSKAERRQALTIPISFQVRQLQRLPLTAQGHISIPASIISLCLEAGITPEWFVAPRNSFTGQLCLPLTLHMLDDINTLISRVTGPLLSCNISRGTDIVAVSCAVLAGS